MPQVMARLDFEIGALSSGGLPSQVARLGRSKKSTFGSTGRDGVQRDDVADEEGCRVEGSEDRRRGKEGKEKG